MNCLGIHDWLLDEEYGTYFYECAQCGIRDYDVDPDDIEEEGEQE